MSKTSSPQIIPKWILDLLSPDPGCRCACCNAIRAKYRELARDA